MYRHIEWIMDVLCISVNVQFKFYMMGGIKLFSRIGYQ